MWSRPAWGISGICRKAQLGVDLDHDFTPIISPVKGKEAMIKELKTAAEEAQTVSISQPTRTARGRPFPGI